jgi:hypothetical protein
MVTKIRYFGTILVLAAALFSARAAQATGEHCTNDIDCKTGPSCGGEICDWNKAMTCQPATASGSGHEGWCTANTDCKCAAQGATCPQSSFQCTKTVDAAGSGGGTGSGGSGSSAAGSSAAGSSAAGSSAAGSSATSDSSSSSSGCSFAGVAPRGSLNLTLGAACAFGLAFARRRKRVAG